MAKKQTFGDKLKKKDESKLYVKVIKWYHSEERGTLRCAERVVPVKDISEVEKVDITK